MNYPSVASFFFMFLFIYLFGYFLIFRHWGDTHRAEAASCLASLAHGTPAVFMATIAILTAQITNFSSPNTPLQNMVLDYGIAYFLLDLLHYLVFFPSDILFILHHLATLYVFLTCRYVVCHGAFALLILLVLAEVTSACQNIWTLADFRKTHVPAAKNLHELMSPFFYAFYSVARGIIGPFVVYKIGIFYLSGGANNFIPTWAWVSWLTVISIAILISISWVFNHWVDWFTQKGQALLEKQR
ncbi:TLC domain-containing protein At5g14285-like [Carica papaya]|uniref:TLC domain-containing protein At5g14285-like n=1 Tax=Carica papaya TaxID=3649 RepID=UPI000B8D121E|nr:TLC domain-containing protein At5g14285-like [Carica papaya]